MNEWMNFGHIILIFSFMCSTFYIDVEAFGTRCSKTRNMISRHTQNNMQPWTENFAHTYLIAGTHVAIFGCCIINNTIHKWCIKWWYERLLLKSNHSCLLFRFSFCSFNQLITKLLMGQNPIVCPCLSAKLFPIAILLSINLIVFFFCCLYFYFYFFLIYTQFTSP